MQSKNNIKQSPAAWKELLSSPTPQQVLILAVFFFASCLVLPLANDTHIATVYMLGAVCLYYGMNRSLKSLLHYALPVLPLILLSGILPTPNLMVLPCAYVALLVGGSTGGFLLTHYHKPQHVVLWLLAPGAAVGAVTLLTHLPSRALLALLPAALALAAGIGLARGAACKDAVLIIGAALVVSLALSGVITLAVRGQLHGNVLQAACDRVRDYILHSAAEAERLYAQAGLEIEIPRAELTAAATAVINLAPGIVLALSGMVAFLLWRSLLSMLTAFHSLPRLPLRLAAFGMSRTSAVLFLGATVISLLAGAEGGVAAAVCDNLTLALIPGLAMIGFVALMGRGRERSCLSGMITLGLILLLVIDVFSALTLAAAFGAVTVLTARFLPHPHDNDNQKGE